MEGNCMPVIDPATTTCKTCPVKRKVRIYEYTLQSQATPNTGGFYDSFSTKLITEVETDDIGFYQIVLPPGKYTIVTIENGKLHASGLDGLGGLNPFDFKGGLLKINMTMHYKAVF
jgi:hypothetical protein